MRAAGITVVVAMLIGCSHHTESFELPADISDFAALYGSNCSGCHGKDGRSGAARPLHDPLFLAVIGPVRLQETIARGVPHTAMTAFAIEAGGPLTQKQIAILADGMEKRWSAASTEEKDLPGYSATLGNADRGSEVYAADCADCHDKGKAGRVLDPNFLKLASDQSLRTTVIAGRQDQGMPDYRHHNGRVMSSQEIADVVAWLSFHRGGTGRENPGGQGL
jgi:mono/diheme cytochrome c family protein